MNQSHLEQLKLSADSWSLKTGVNEWYELMHWHPDIYGSGNADSESRQYCLKLLRQYFDRGLKALVVWDKPAQCWALVDPNDSSQDAFYVHTPNPNRDNFPYEFEEVTWGVAAPEWLSSAFPLNLFKFGESEYEGAKLYWVVSA